MNDYRVLYICGFAFIFASLLLIIMSFVPWPFNFIFPGESVLTGMLSLNPAQISQFISSSGYYLIIETLFIILWFIGWVGIGLLVKVKNKTIGNIVLITGLLGPLLDFLENAFIWGMIKQLEIGIPAASNSFVLYSISSQMSYFFPFTAAVLASVYLLKKSIPNIIMFAVCSVFIVPAIFSMYIPELHILKVVWFLLFFIASAMLLLKEAYCFSRTESIIMN